MHLECRDVVKKAGSHPILNHITCTVPDCRSLIFLGPSGGGKSTLLRTVAGLIIPDSGEVALNGEILPKREEDLIAYRRTIGTVFQSWNLFPHLTVLQNIALPLRYVHNIPKEEAAVRSFELLKRFGLQEEGDKRPAELSGGQSQRVAIVRAVAIRPKLLLFDEPTSALDPIMTAEVLDLIKELKEEGSDFILVSHHIGFAQKISDYVAFIDSGKVLEVSPTEHFFASPKTSAAKTFLASVLKY